MSLWLRPLVNLNDARELKNTWKLFRLALWKAINWDHVFTVIRRISDFWLSKSFTTTATPSLRLRLVLELLVLSLGLGLTINTYYFGIMKIHVWRAGGIIVPCILRDECGRAPKMAWFSVSQCSNDRGVIAEKVNVCITMVEVKKTPGMVLWWDKLESGCSNLDEISGEYRYLGV